MWNLLLGWLGGMATVAVLVASCGSGVTPQARQATEQQQATESRFTEHKREFPDYPDRARIPGYIARPIDPNESKAAVREMPPPLEPPDEPIALNELDWWAQLVWGGSLRMHCPVSFLMMMEGRYRTVVKDCEENGVDPPNRPEFVERFTPHLLQRAEIALITWRTDLEEW